MAVGIAKFLERPFDDLAGTNNDPRRDKDVADLAAVGAAVHPHEPADSARNAAKEFEAGNAFVARGGGNKNPARAAAAT